MTPTLWTVCGEPAVVGVGLDSMAAGAAALAAADRSGAGGLIDSEFS